MTLDLSVSQSIRIGLITAVALGVYAGFRLLPTGTNLSHMDFRVKGGNSIEFCDPANPQFIPVVAVRSPVTMTLASARPPLAGESVAVSVRLRTSSGKGMGPSDLLVSHSRKLHLLLIDPSLMDYQHVHPVPGRVAGEWSFAFVPKWGGNYRVFADFTPAATGKGLYAGAELAVQGAAFGGVAPRFRIEPVQSDGFVFELHSLPERIRAKQQANLVFSVSRSDGGVVPLEPVMGAYAHLVAFDVERGGFAHLHPGDLDVTKAPDARSPVLSFKVTIPKSGRFVIWSQVAIAGSERFVPFWFEVDP